MNFRVSYSDDFLKSAKKLPKPLTGLLTGLYSFRITRDWRVVFQFIDRQTIKLISVGHRRDIYRRG